MDCFVDAKWARRHSLPILSLSQTHAITALDGRPLGHGLVTDIMLMSIQVDNHVERIRFFGVDSPSFPLVLGHTWLVKHKPLIN